jgi:hypothetical protein
MRALILREELELQKFGNKELMKIFRPKNDEVRVQFRILHNEKLLGYAIT